MLYVIQLHILHKFVQEDTLCRGEHLQYIGFGCIDTLKEVSAHMHAHTVHQYVLRNVH